MSRPLSLWETIRAAICDVFVGHCEGISKYWLREVAKQCCQTGNMVRTTMRNKLLDEEEIGGNSFFNSQLEND